ncbi:hypothetical protein ACWD26_39955 [Streptomyces sp. NPDC002787]
MRKRISAVCPRNGYGTRYGTGCRPAPARSTLVGAYVAPTTTVSPYRYG